MLGSPEAKVPVRALVFPPLVDAAFAFLAEGCEATDLRNRLGEFDAAFMPAAEREAVEVVVSSGIVGFTAAQMDLLPNLKLIASFSVGFENIDLEAAAARGIAVTNAPATNGETVADHTIMLMMAAARGLPEVMAAARAGHWNEARKRYRPTLNGSRVGMLGLGAIGAAIATRASAFNATVSYTTRTEKPGVPYRHVPDLMALAAESDFLVAAIPGGPATRHLIDATVLDALGPNGVLVNVGRGSVVDSQALATALKEGRIHAAGVDVLEEEPDIPAALLDAPNLVVTPHMAGRSPIGLRRQCERALDNIGRLRRGEPFVCRVG
ncbi:2-hydroxyacid dehydrogenase [Acuticoccus sediminis]|nr:2-hydroxyacid dehydrogenase [Acuticoccus sediminis]